VNSDRTRAQQQLLGGHEAIVRRLAPRHAPAVKDDTMAAKAVGCSRNGRCPSRA
jgi:hypothetical protein